MDSLPKRRRTTATRRLGKSHQTLRLSRRFMQAQGGIDAEDQIAGKGFVNSETADSEAQKIIVLTRGVFHDANNILAALDYASYKLDMSRMTDARCRQSIAEIQENVRRLKHLIGQYLRYTNKKPPEFEECDLDYELSFFCDYSRHIFEEEGISIGYLAEINDYTIRLDKDLIIAAITNLLINAKDAFRQKEGNAEKRIIISMKKKKFENYQVPGHIKILNGEYIVITVIDNACGISPKCIQTIFEPGFTTKGSGMGLGLANVKRTIEEHKGVITVESKQNAYTRFAIYLPVAN